MKKAVFILWICFPVLLFAQGYQVSPLQIEPGKSATMCPVMYQGEVVYMSNKKVDFVKTVKDVSSSFPFNLYKATVDSNNHVQQKRLFSKALMTSFNDGPVCFFDTDQKMVVSRNNRTKVFGDSDEKRSLGLFFSENKDGIWSEPKAFPYNSDEYNLTHPAINEEGNLLVFSSDMSGSLGGADLFFSVRSSSGEWSSPKNMGASINTEGNELFPSFFRNRLYFSTNGRSSREDLDIWYVDRTNERWEKAYQVDKALNSEQDDFGITFHRSGQSGYFSSNRDGKDAIYHFERDMMMPSFEDCPAQKRISYCYQIEEYNMLDESGMPLKFVWELGDGTKKDGYRVQHCYDSVGTYTATLTIIDTLTGDVFYEVSSVLIDIVPDDSPYIVCNDSIGIGQPLNIRADLQWMSKQPQDIFWKFQDASVQFGNEANTSFSKNEEQTIRLATIDDKGNVHCVSRTVKVKEGKIPITARDTLVQEGLNTNPDSLSYSVQIHESEQQTDLNDHLFDKVNYPVTERYKEEDSLYHYMVGESHKMGDLYPLYREMKELGLDSKLISFERKKELAVGDRVKKQTIYFSVNSDSITPYNEMMLQSILTYFKENDRLLIEGFADVSGNLDSNLALSKRRAQKASAYFQAKGVDPKKIMVKAKGELGKDAQNDEELQYYRKVVVKIVSP